MTRTTHEVPLTGVLPTSYCDKEDGMTTVPGAAGLPYTPHSQLTHAILVWVTVDGYKL